MTSGHHDPAKRRRSTTISSVKCTAKRSKSESLIHSLPEGIMHDNSVTADTQGIKDAFRTSLVSTNWRRLWTYHPNLCFDSPTILNRKSGSRSKRRRQRFIRRVNAVLESHTGAGLRRFKIAFAPDMRHTKHLDRWFNFALASRATEVDVNLLPETYRYTRVLWSYGKKHTPCRFICLVVKVHLTLSHFSSSMCR